MVDRGTIAGERVTARVLAMSSFKTCS